MNHSPTVLRALTRAGVQTCAALWWFGASPASAQIYVGGSPGPNGGVVLSNHATPDTPTLLLALDLPAELEPTAPVTAAAGLAVASRIRPTAALHPSPSTSALIGAVARDHSVAEALVKAVIAVESGFDPNARSIKGAMGLMQLMPETARRFGVRNAYAVEENLRAGTAYLRRLLDLFAGDVTLALAAYNAGEGAVLRAGSRIPDIAETRAYVPKVLSYQAYYSAQAKTPTP